MINSIVDVKHILSICCIVTDTGENFYFSLPSFKYLSNFMNFSNEILQMNSFLVQPLFAFFMLLLILCLLWFFFLEYAI